jgi:predicted metal-dependent enzyme (double-stranded beta helix superfamily)
MPETLRELVHSLDAALEMPQHDFAAAVTTALGCAVRRRDWLPAAQCQPGTERYQRHLLHADPLDRYTVVSLVWDRDQGSPVHAHYTWCGVAVYSGSLCETFYAGERDAIQPLRSIDREEGSVSFDPGDSGIHRISNPGGPVAISIHVYGIGAARVATGVNRVLG